MLALRPTDSLDMMKLKLDLANLRAFYQMNISAAESLEATSMLKRVWKRWAEAEP